MVKKYVLTINGTDYEVIAKEVPFDASNATVAPKAAPAPAAAPVAAPAAAPAPAASAAPANGLKIEAPLPGNILKINVSVGDSVKKGDTLCVLEAMKMENDIPAPQDGTVKSVATTKGASVNTGDLLFVLG